jgi:cysteine-rich repeat protein
VRTFIVLVLIAGAIGCGGGDTGNVGDDDGGDPPADAQGDDPDAAPPDAGPPDAVCGNGVIEDGETCDDSNAATEACAYGETSCTVCDATCHEVAGATSYCGDNTTDAANSEACDDGNHDLEACAYGVASCLVCAADCTLVAGATSYCNDGVTDAANGETCEDGNTTTETCAYGATSCTVCDAQCHETAGTTSYCGDSTTDGTNSEQCDDGNTVKELCAYGDVACLVCDATCQSVPGNTSYCGDGFTDSSNTETCDDLNATTETCAYGATSCTVCDAACHETAGATSYCGDGTTDGANGETCDDGNTTTEACAYGEASCTVCDAACHQVAGATSLCGDGIRDAANGERCDDGNAIDDDGCLTSCQFACGGDTTATKAWSTDFGCVLRHDTTATFAAASATCVAEGGELATILSAEQNTAFFDRLGGVTAWIGLGDVAVEGTMAWESGVPVAYTYWDGVEPNNAGNNEDCVQMLTNGRWNDIPCTSSFRYFCLTPTCGNGTTDAGETCDTGDRITESCAYGAASCEVCDATCELVAGDTDLCNDGTIDAEEQCDGDVAGCSSCSIAPGWTCPAANTCFVGDAAQVGPGAALGVTDNGYNGTQASMRCVPLVVDANAGELVGTVEVTLGMTQTYVGDLVIKLYHPSGSVVTLMSRPGYAETVDDGTGGSGDNANVLAAFPITFADGAPVSAENMGTLNTDTNLTICRDDAQCRFAPAAGITGTGTLASLTGTETAGTWQLCVGDAASQDVPTIDYVLLKITRDGESYCGDGLVDTGEECDDGVLDGTACDGLCLATVDLGARLLQHCDFTSDPVAIMSGAGCHTLDDSARTQASALLYDFPGTAILYEAAGCAGESYEMTVEDTFCALGYPSGNGLNDNVGSVWLGP